MPHRQIWTIFRYSVKIWEILFFQETRSLHTANTAVILEFQRFGNL